MAFFPGLRAMTVRFSAFTISADKAPLAKVTELLELCKKKCLMVK